MTRYIAPCIAITFLVFTALPQTAFSAGETNNCHCFRNRTFNPADKFVSDEYLLTTTFNSLLASEFNISKRQIIMMKMGEGVANNDLVTALYLSRSTGLEVAQLLAMKKKQSWQEIITPLQDKTEAPETKKLFDFILSGSSDQQIAEQIITGIIAARFSPSPESLQFFSQHDMNAREIILAGALANHTGATVPAIVDQYRQKGLSWSEIAHNFGLEPSEVGKLLENGKPKAK
ncbi:MAG TPA: hypothetical protein ENO11_04835 [Desulfobacteraceae bacterium]|nr:hypothetical protein [Desulfobacteraceae bacterium]